MKELHEINDVLDMLKPVEIWQWEPAGFGKWQNMLKLFLMMTT